MTVELTGAELTATALTMLLGEEGVDFVYYNRRCSMVEEYVEYYPATVLAEQDTNESYWHNLAHLLPSLRFLEWMELTVSWIVRTKDRWN